MINQINTKKKPKNILIKIKIKIDIMIVNGDNIQLLHLLITLLFTKI